MNILERLNGQGRATDGNLSVHDLQVQIVHLEAKLSLVASRAAALAAENRQLRRNYRRQRATYSQIVYRAIHDCELMYALFLSGFETTRQRCADVLGISRRRWDWARALAQLAGVHDGVEFTGHEMADFLQRLRDAAALAEEQPELLRQYLPRNGGTPGR